MSELSWLCSASNPPHLNPLPASGARPDERVQARPGSLRFSREARLSLWQRERIKVRVSTNTAAAAQARSPARRCRVPGEPDDSRTAGQRFSHERATPSAFGREFDPSDSDARHRLIQLRALPPVEIQYVSVERMLTAKFRFRKWRQRIRSVSVAFFRNKRARFMKSYLSRQSYF